MHYYSYEHNTTLWTQHYCYERNTAPINKQLKLCMQHSHYECNTTAMNATLQLWTQNCHCECMTTAMSATLLSWTHHHCQEHMRYWPEAGCLSKTHISPQPLFIFIFIILVPVDRLEETSFASFGTALDKNNIANNKVYVGHGKFGCVLYTLYTLYTFPFLRRSVRRFDIFYFKPSTVF